MEIKSISGRILSPLKNKAENINNQTNPFGVNFKGNMITADVFESAAPKLAQKAANKGKLLVSAIVGSINDVNDAISRRLDSVMQIGRNIRENAINLRKDVAENIARGWEYLNGTKLVLNIGNNEPLISLKKVDNSWTKEGLSQNNLEELTLMFENLVTARVA